MVANKHNLSARVLKCKVALVKVRVHAHSDDAKSQGWWNSTRGYWPSWPRLSFLSQLVWLMKAAGHRKCAEKCKSGIWVTALSLDTQIFGVSHTIATCNNFPLLLSRGWLYFFAGWFIFFVLHYNILCWRLGMSREKNRLVLRPVHKFSPARLFFCRARGSVCAAAINLLEMRLSLRLKCI